MGNDLSPETQACPDLEYYTDWVKNDILMFLTNLPQ